MVERLVLALTLLKESAAAKALASAGITPQNLNRAIEDIRKGRRADNASAEEGYDALKKYARDLTAVARDGKLDPVIRRDHEIRRTVPRLPRRTKNNPVLIGEPGGGKTAIGAGRAQRIISGDVPEVLKNKRAVALDLADMLSGENDRGEFEARLTSLLQDIEESHGKLIRF